MSPDGRIMITNTRRGGEVESTLLIDPIMPSDVGLYHCTAQNIAGPSQRNFNLTQVLGRSPVDILTGIKKPQSPSCFPSKANMPVLGVLEVMKKKYLEFKEVAS